MIKEKIQKAMELLKPKEGEQNNKRKVENLVVFAVILIVTIIMINVILNEDSNKKNDKNKDETKVLASTIIENSEETKQEDLETRLEKILSKIDGVGKVEVLLTYSESSKVEAMYNEDSTTNDTEEQDKERR